MSGHVGTASNPFGSVKLGISPPGVAILTTTAPLAFRDVVVKVDVDLLTKTLSSNGVVNLWLINIVLWKKPVALSYLKTCCLGSKGRVILQHLCQNNSSVLFSKTLFKSSLDIDVLAAVGIDLINHLCGEGKTNGVHANALDI
ncbi:hypothetical protein HG531_012393 [Fusarium graminearum]|nr:hypothetical protein HG531_012393 [Fusarium graminearum]